MDYKDSHIEYKFFGLAVPCVYDGKEFRDCTRTEMSLLDDIRMDNIIRYMPQVNIDTLDVKKTQLMGGVTKFDNLYSSKELQVVTTYISKYPLSELQIQTLMKYTQGQWSDGVGSGFSQEPCLKVGENEFYIDPWYIGQKIECCITDNRRGFTRCDSHMQYSLGRKWY